MSLESLSQDINSQVDAKKQELVSTYNQELELFQKAIEEEIATYKNNLYNSYQQEFEEKKSQIIGDAQSKANKILLETKAQYQKNLQKKVEELVINLDEKTKKQCYQRFLNSLKKEFSFKIVEVSPKDKALIQSLLTDATIITNSKSIGGIKAYSEDMQFSIDLTFTTIIEEIFSEV